jgi:hypothetical protein
LLDIIEEKQELALAQESTEADIRQLATKGKQSQGLRNGRENELRVEDGHEGNEADAVGEKARDITRGLERKPGLADTTGARQSEETDIIPRQEVADGGNFLFASNEGREGNGKRRVLAVGLIADHEIRAPVSAVV